MDIGNGCNLSCPGCYYKKADWRRISREDEKALIEKAIKKFKSSFFLYPPEAGTSQYLIDLMGKVNQKIILTNATKLDDSMIDWLLENGIKYVKVTYFANYKEQKFWQNISEERYKLIRNNMENAAKRGLSVFVNNVLWRGNIKSIVELAKQSYDMGAERIKFIRFLGKEYREEYITDKDMDEVVTNIEEAKTIRSPRIQVSFAFAGPNFYGKSLEDARKKLPPQEGEWVKSKYMCPAINGDYLGVSFKKGEVYWCYFMKDEPIGTIDNDLNIKIDKNIDLSEETLKKRLKGRCSKDKCEYQSICLGGCRRTAYITSGWKGNPDIYSGMDTCLTDVYRRLGIKK